MALSGSQKAYKQARSGIARSGATRSGYYFPNVVITIDNGGAPVDVTPYVAYNGWSVSLNLNDDVDTATLALLPTCPFVPQTRSPVKIGLGAINNLAFAGIVLTVQRTRKPGPDPRSWYDLTCIDWTALLDAHLVVADYPTQSATTTIIDIVERFTRAFISTAGVAPNLPNVANMTIVNERPSTVLRRITNKIGGGFYLDADRVLHAWSSAIPSPMQAQAPVPLTDHLSTLKTFRVTEDASQQRTRVFVEGQRTSTLLGVPGLPLNNTPEVPVTEGKIVTAGKKIRLGLQLGDTGFEYSPVADTSNNPPGTVMIGSAIIGSAMLTVQSTAAFRQAGGWCQVASQVVRYGVIDATHFSIPPSGYGSLQAPVADGAQLIDLPYFIFDASDRPTSAANPNPAALPWVRVPVRAQSENTPAVLVVWRADDPAAQAINLRERSDGYYEHLVQDGRYNAEGATARADAELADFAQPTLTYEWETEDLNAEPGRMQHIAFTEGTPLTTDVRITNVDVVPLASNCPPRRHVRAAKIQTAGVVDIWVDDTR